MSLTKTNSTGHWNTIPKKCKECRKAIYTVENGEVYYQCSVFGKFKKDCTIKTDTRKLPKPSEIIKE